MKLQAAAVFSSDMVLQREAAVPVWGTAAPGAVVTFRLTPGGLFARTTADPDGRWTLTLPPQPAGGPFTAALQSGDDAQTFTGVYFGEVWLAGGQSNMELPLSGSRNGEAVLAACHDELLHFYETPKVTTVEAAEAAPSRWQIVGPETAANLSAVAYYAARELAHALHVHVGILECFWGGTYAHCWLPRELLATFPEGCRRLAWYDARVGDKTDAEFDAELAAYQAEVDSWNARIAARRAADPDVSWTVLNEECGLYPWPPPAGRTGFQRPGNLYESMLRRVCPYALRGFWYYQGEQDEEWPQDYETELTCLVRRWRADWQDADAKLPFLLVQLPMYATGAGENSWPTLRAAQAAVADREPNAGLVVLADLGEADNIHPVDKAPAGQRLALLALDTVYGRPVAGCSPRLAEATVQGDTALLRFARTAGSLKLAEGPSGFELAGADGRFAPAQALAAGDTVTLHSPDVARPAFVRYAWYNFGPARLYGGTGLPAVPFGTTPLTSV